MSGNTRQRGGNIEIWQKEINNGDGDTTPFWWEKKKLTVIVLLEATMKTKVIRMIGNESIISSFNTQKSNIIIKYNQKLEFKISNKTEEKTQQ